MQKLDYEKNSFPVTGMRNLRFKTSDGVIHIGRYDFNDIGGRRWFDEKGREYTSDMVTEWEEMYK